MKPFKTVIVLVLLLGCFMQVVAQALDCPALVNEALASAGNICMDTGRNQVCYGNLDLEAEFRPGFKDITFDAPGDRANIAGLTTLRSTAADAGNEVWGIALMRIQANLPDTLPGQTVTMILFGGARVENAVASNPNAPALEITIGKDTILQAAPSVDGQIIGALVSGDTATALGQSADGLWLRIEMHDQDRRLGWVSVAAAGDADIAQLPVIDPNVPSLTPLQAFYLHPNFTGERCTEAPDGMLVQTPGEGVVVDLTVNEVHFSLGSTAFIQVGEGNELEVSLLEGQGTVETGGVTVDLPGGYQTGIPLDADGRPSGPPQPPEPYDLGRFGTLPTALLPETIAPVSSVWGIGQTLCVSNPGGAWLRGAPSSTNQDIVRVLPDGSPVAVEGESQFDGAQTWWPVRTGNSTGWIEQSSLVACTQPVPPPCTPRTDWLFAYTVRAGDTLSRIAAAAGITLDELAAGNCLVPPYNITVGMVIRLPRQPVFTTAVPPTVPPVQTAVPVVTQPVNPAGTVPSGDWSFTIYRGDCAGNITQEGANLFVQASSDGSTITFTDNGESRTLQRVSAGQSGNPTYAGSYQTTIRNTVVTLQYYVSATVIGGTNVRATMEITATCSDEQTSS